MATSSSITWVVASTGKSTSVGPSPSSAQSSSSPVVAQVPAVESSMRASTICAWVIESELAPLPIWIAALTPDPAGTATPEVPLVVTDRVSGWDARGAVPSHAVTVNASGASHSARRIRDSSIMSTSAKGISRRYYPRLAPGVCRKPEEPRGMAPGLVHPDLFQLDLPQPLRPRQRQPQPRPARVHGHVPHHRARRGDLDGLGALRGRVERHYRVDAGLVVPN